ncbi:MAG: hypothetical protein ACREK3_05075 [Gemmatimonadota bacterium]
MCLGLSLDCSAPISTMRSPMHLRVVELFNETQDDWIITIEPTADQHLGAATTFTGRFRPGEKKTLYLYHGLRYQVDVLESRGEPVTSAVYQVDRDMGLVFGGDSLRPVVRLTAELGEPTMTFSDSLQVLDPFGLRRSSRPIQPDTTSFRGRAQREEQGRRGARGELP